MKFAEKFKMDITGNGGQKEKGKKFPFGCDKDEKGHDHEGGWFANADINIEGSIECDVSVDEIKELYTVTKQQNIDFSNYLRNDLKKDVAAVMDTLKDVAKDTGEIVYNIQKDIATKDEELDAINFEIRVKKEQRENEAEGKKPEAKR